MNEALATVGVVVAIVTGIGGLVFGFLGWCRSGTAIEETRRTRVRDEQHTIIAELAEPTAELGKLIGELNFDVQQWPAKTDVLRAKAKRLRELVSRMSQPVIVDPALSESIERLRSVALPTTDGTTDIPSRLEQFADLWDSFDAKSKPDSQATPDELFGLGAGYGSTMEPLRERCNDLQPITESIRSRIEDIGRYGLGDFPTKPRKRRDR